MACFRPWPAWQLETGEIVFKERGKVARELTLPCGRCVGCRASRARQWAIRCIHEASLHQQNAFVTLTYDEEHASPSLCYLDFQLFMKRFRRKFGPVRFYMCGEYGERSYRAHYHALLFGWYPTDGVQCGKDIVSSRELSSVWEKGFAAVGQVSYESAGYVARYVMKKQYDGQNGKRYERVDPSTGEIYKVEPEFSKMSLKPGIGAGWFDKYWKDVYIARDGVVQAKGRVSKAPRYYDRLLERIDPYLKDEKDFERYVKSTQFADDCTPERLQVREFCATEREKLRSRSL